MGREEEEGGRAEGGGRGKTAKLRNGTVFSGQAQNIMRQSVRLRGR